MRLGLVLKESSANTIPTSNNPITLGCWGKGPDNCDDYVEDEIQKFLDSPGGWLILNLHGLENEGWGPVSTKYLDNLLSRMIKIDYLDVLPTGEVFKKVVG